MKKYIYLIFIILFTIESCSEEFTSVDPVGILTDAQLANETGIDLLLTGAYSVLDGVRNGGNGGWGRSADNWVMDVVSDDAHKGSTDSDQADLFELEVYNWATGNGYFIDRWEVLYAGVNRANSVIKLINSVEDPSVFNVEMAQARFLRGHFNFELLKIFGNVSYISDENAANFEFNQPNSGDTKLGWSHIESDFTFAKDNLPSSRTADYLQAGRPLSWTALAFLGKAQLYQGKWGEALTSLEKVINSGTYGLHENLLDNFLSATENGKESVFAIQYSADDAQSMQGNTTGALNFPGGGPFGSCCGFYQPTQDLVNAYQTENGLPLLNTFQDTHVANDYGLESFEKDDEGNVTDIPTPFDLHTGSLDPRLDFTVGRRGIDYNGYGVHIGKDWIRASFADISGPYLPKKNIYTKGDDPNIGTGSWGQQLSGINYHIMRYADVILMAAEAAVESGDLEKGRGYVNQIRERAMNMTYVKSSDGTADAANYEIALYPDAWTDQETARKSVRFERRLELAMEGHRSFDLRRWGVAETVINQYIAKEAEVITTFSKGQVYQSKHDFFPIPLSAIDGSGGVLKQNPGY